MDLLKGGLWPMGDYPNLLGITPGDRRPKSEEYNIDLGDPFGEKTVYVKTPMRKEDISMPEECSIRYLADRIFVKAKAELKRAAKKLKAKEEQIDIQKQAIIRAHQEMEGVEQ